MNEKELEGAFGEKLASVPAGIHSLRVLNAGWEGGNTQVEIDGELWDLKLGTAGGMGVVIPQLPLAVLEFAQRRGLRWTLANVSPLFPEIITAVRDVEQDGHKVTERLPWQSLVARGIVTNTQQTWTVAYEGKEYAVALWEVKVTHKIYKHHMTHYLLQQDDLWGPGRLAKLSKTSGGPTETDLYEVPGSNLEDVFPAGALPEHVSTPFAIPRLARIRYWVFARSIARLYYGCPDPASGEKFVPEFQVLISHDYHAGLASFFEQPDSPMLQLSVGHNLGYQGVDGFYSWSPGDPAYLLDCTDSGNWATLKQLYADRLGLTLDQVESCFVAWAGPDYIGTPNWLQAVMRKNYQRTGLAITTVSPGYAKEQKVDRQGVLEQAGKISKDSEGIVTVDPDYTPEACQARLAGYFNSQTLQNDLFVPNQNLPDLTRYHVVGVLNGMFPEQSHLVRSGRLNEFLGALRKDLARRESQLKDVQDQAAEAKRTPRAALDTIRELQRTIQELRDAIREVDASAKEVQEFFADEHYLSPESTRTADRKKFAERFQRAADALETIKKKAKAHLFRAFEKHFEGIDRKTFAERPILFAWGRLVSQKAFHIIEQALRGRSALGQAGKPGRTFEDALVIVLATAPNGDTEAIEVERWLLERNAQKDPRFVFVNARDDAFRDTCLLAADAALLTSLYEPCGLTDIEAYWFGVPCVVHEVGGLAKGVRDPEMYTQIARNYPPDAPVAAAYTFCDNTNPGAEAELLVQKCNDLLSWDERQRKNLQLKALTLLEFSYEIPANRYIDLIQYVWLSQLWRWLKDQRGAASSDTLAEQAAKWIAADRGSFRAGKGHGCCSSLRDLYAWAFVPPTEPIGISELDEDIRLDCQLRQRLDEVV